jgi:hypothetical protein
MKGAGRHIGGAYLLREHTVTACFGQLRDLVFKTVLLFKRHSGISVVHLMENPPEENVATKPDTWPVTN